MLSDDEITDMWVSASFTEADEMDLYAFARAVERAAYERAAQECEAQISGSDYQHLATHGHWDHMAQSATNCADAIRALLPPLLHRSMTMPPSFTIDTRVLDGLQSRRHRLLSLLDRLDMAITREQNRLTERYYRVKVGSIVRARRGRLYRVAEVDASWFPSRPWLAGNPQLKSGAYGKGIHNLFSDWELIE